jgi:hypothetical protein
MAGLPLVLVQRVTCHKTTSLSDWFGGADSRSGISRFCRLVRAAGQVPIGAYALLNNNLGTSTLPVYAAHETVLEYAGHHCALALATQCR